jgi:hypothetical protein
MNRLYHLKETLLRNIEDNRDYANLEHVVLDYNSRDDMEAWAKAHLGEYIQSGRVKYYRTTEPESFNMAHSKNMVARLAEGEIICLTDADNFTGRNYAAYVDATFQERKDVFMTAIGARKTTNPTDVLGRVCCRKADLLAVKGFDESMRSYGFDDHDFANRLALLGRQRIVITDKRYLCAIPHSLGERIHHYSTKASLKEVYIHLLDPARTALLFLFAPDSYHFGIIRDNAAAAALRAANAANAAHAAIHGRPRKSAGYSDVNHRYEQSLTTPDWKQGTWKQTPSGLTLSPDPGSSTDPFRKITNEQMITEVLLLHSILPNRNRMVHNKRRKQAVIGQSAWGCGNVYRNFDYSTAIHLPPDA